MIIIIILIDEVRNSILDFFNNINDEINEDPYKNMPHMKKLMTQKIDDIKSTNRNKISLQVLDSIKEKCESSVTQVTDTLNLIIGGFMTTSQIVESDVFSKMMTDLFEDTDIKVYIYISSSPNAFTLPGTKIVSTPFLMRIQQILSSVTVRLATYLSSFFGSFILTAGNFFQLFLNLLEEVLVAGRGKFLYGSSDYVEFNPKTKKIKISIKSASIYVSSNLIKLLNNDKELTAVLLHEIGHNVKLTYTIMENILSMGWVSSLLPGFYYELKAYKSTSYEELDSNVSKAKLWIFGSAVIFIFAAFMSAYVSRRNETYSDEFAIKCGYGRYLTSAIKKMHTLSNEFTNIINKKETAKANETFISKISSSLSGIMKYLESYPSQEEREDMLERKSNLYDTSKNNTNRTENIKNY